MKLDFASFAFGYKVLAGGGTPNWATALGQGKGYKINDSLEINEMLKGITYCAVSPTKVSTKIGKGGKMVSGSDPDSPIINCAVFEQVYVNDALIPNGKFVLLVTRDTSESHAGRLRLKYGPSNTYHDGITTYSNDQLFEKIRNQFGMAENACWFVSRITIRNQNELILKTTFVNKDDTEVYPDTPTLHKTWLGLDPELDLSDDDRSTNSAKGSIYPVISPRINPKYPLNQILYGAPGTGKTYATAQYSVAILEDADVDAISKEKRSDVMDRYNQYKKDGRIVFTTFHQNYGYEDFIQGIRPDTSSEDMRFQEVDGIFKRIADKAMDDPNNNYVLIIDEINRANISKTFGELITLIEEDKRWGEVNALDIVLPSGGPFAVPNNLYIVGTMNSADKSISLIDAALRRRFKFVEFVPNLQLINDKKLAGVLKELNDNIESELGGTDLLIGHSYFMNKTEDDLEEIMNHNVIPLLYEYYFDEKKKVKNTLEHALKNLKYTIETGSMGRIRIKKDK